MAFHGIMYAHTKSQLASKEEMTFVVELTEDMVALEVELGTGIEVRLAIR